MLNISIRIRWWFYCLNLAQIHTFQQSINIFNVKVQCRPYKMRPDYGMFLWKPTIHVPRTLAGISSATFRSCLLMTEGAANRSKMLRVETVLNHLHLVCITCYLLIVYPRNKYCMYTTLLWKQSLIAFVPVNGAFITICCGNKVLMCFSVNDAIKKCCG